MAVSSMQSKSEYMADLVGISLFLVKIVKSVRKMAGLRFVFSRKEERVEAKRVSSISSQTV